VGTVKAEDEWAMGLVVSRVYGGAAALEKIIPDNIRRRTRQEADTD